MKYKVRKENGRTIYTAICSRCDCILTYVGSHNQKYCQECGSIVQREKARERMRRYRKKQTAEGGDER